MVWVEDPGPESSIPVTEGAHGSPLPTRDSVGSGLVGGDRGCCDLCAP